MSNETKTAPSHYLMLQIVKRSLLPLLVIILLALLYVIHALQFKPLFSAEANNFIQKAILTIFALIIASWLQRILTVGFNWYALNIAAKTKSRLDNEFIPLLSRDKEIALP